MKICRNTDFLAKAVSCLQHVKLCSSVGAVSTSGTRDICHDGRRCDRRPHVRRRDFLATRGGFSALSRGFHIRSRPGHFLRSRWGWQQGTQILHAIESMRTETSSTGDQSTLLFKARSRRESVPSLVDHASCTSCCAHVFRRTEDGACVFPYFR